MWLVTTIWDHTSPRSLCPSLPSGRTVSPTGGVFSVSSREGETILLPPSILLGGAHYSSRHGASAVTTRPLPRGEKAALTREGARRWSFWAQPEGEAAGWGLEESWGSHGSERRGKEEEEKSRVQESTFTVVGLLHRDTYFMLTPCEGGRR